MFVTLQNFTVIYQGEKVFDITAGLWLRCSNHCLNLQHAETCNHIYHRLVKNMFDSHIKASSIIKMLKTESKLFNVSQKAAHNKKHTYGIYSVHNHDNECAALWKHMRSHPHTQKIVQKHI